MTLPPANFPVPTRFANLLRVGDEVWSLQDGCRCVVTKTPHRSSVTAQTRPQGRLTKQYRPIASLRFIDHQGVIETVPPCDGVPPP